MLEIQRMLARAGADSILLEYDNGTPAALSFRLTIGGQPVAFRLPAKAHAVLRVLSSDPQVPKRYRDPEHARRVAWRVIKDWLRAQLALVEAEQATLAEAMLPYAVTPTGQTIYEALEERGPKALQLTNEPL
jgi:hypothetical protein